MAHADYACRSLYGYAHGAYGLFIAASRRSGYSGSRNGAIRLHCLAGTYHHLLDNFAAHSSAFLKGLCRYSEYVALHIVAVGDHTTVEDCRTSRNRGEQVGNVATSTAFGG